MRRSAASILLGVVATLAHAGEPSSLERLMGADAFRGAGLDRQTPEQLHQLETWLAQHAGELATLAPASAAASATAVVQRPAAPARPAPAPSAAVADTPPDRVASRIAGAFTGWQTGTTLTLANGQRWRVSDGSRLVVNKPIDSPAVSLKPGLLGAWYLKVEGYNTTAQVKPAN